MVTRVLGQETGPPHATISPAKRRTPPACRSGPPGSSRVGAPRGRRHCSPGIVVGLVRGHRRRGGLLDPASSARRRRAPWTRDGAARLLLRRAGVLVREPCAGATTPLARRRNSPPTRPPRSSSSSTRPPNGRRPAVCRSSTTARPPRRPRRSSNGQPDRVSVIGWQVPDDGFMAATHDWTDVDGSGDSRDRRRRHRHEPDDRDHAPDPGIDHHARMGARDRPRPLRHAGHDDVGTAGCRVLERLGAHSGRCSGLPLPLRPPGRCACGSSFARCRP